jgi:phenylacetate-CoA ligase
VLTKQDVRRSAPELRARNIPDTWVTVGQTDGTTGYPLRLVLDKRRVIFDRALVHRHWAWAGYRPGDRVVMLREFTLVAPETRSGIYWRRDWVDNRVYLSGFHLSPTSMPLYVRKLQQWQPQFIAAYPSSLFTLARFMERQGVRLPVRAVFTSSEVLTATERRIIEQQFGGRVWDRYGTGERLVVGQQCEQGAYHQNVEFGLLQVDAPRGQPAPTGARGELIHTTLSNLSMPLIRYASEDMGYLVDGRCACGRGLPLMGTVDGRKDDVIVTADGRLMPRAGLDLFEEEHAITAVERCQLVQERPGEIVLRVVPRAGFSPSAQAALVAHLRKQIGESTRIQVDVLETLPRSPTGKERLVVSKLNVDELVGLQVQAPTEAVSQ